MAIKVYGDKIVFPDSTEQTTASTQLDGYTKAEIDAQQNAQDDAIDLNSAEIATNATNIAKNKADITTNATEINKKANTTDVNAKNDLQDIAIQSNKDAIQANTDAIEVNADEIGEKVPEAPIDGKQYARKNKDWSVVVGGSGDVEDAPADGKTYGRKDEAWSEVNTDAYTKAEIDAQQLAQDDAIADNATDIATNTTNIAENATNIAKNTTDIEELADSIGSLTGSITYKGSLNATVVEAPADAVEGDMWINEYNVSEPATNYPLASGWSPVTEAKYDDKLIKTDTGWDLIASVVGVPTYTAGEIDVLLDEKADKDDSYLKAETDALLDDKADSDLVYTKVESDVKNDEQDTAIQENKDAIASIPAPADTYTKDEIDAQQILQNDAIQENADAIDAIPGPTDAYTKAEVDASQSAQDTEIAKKAVKADVDAYHLLQNTEINKKADKETTYTKDEVDSLIEDASGAIVGKYTNKWADSVARDPGAGNLYLVVGMDMTSTYSNVTKIYISDTDGAGDVRDFDEVKEGDKITLTSELGQGEYTIVSISDVTGYRELVVEIESAFGTVANNTPVSIVLDVASSEPAAGIEEAPVDGKQYARQNEQWSEIEQAEFELTEQKPVVFKATMSTEQTIGGGDTRKVNLDTAGTDTHHAFTNGTFKPNVAGWYQVNGSVGSAVNVDNTEAKLYKNGSRVNATRGSSVFVDEGSYQFSKSSNFADVVYLNGTSDYLELRALMYGGVGNPVVTNDTGLTYLSAHLITGQATGIKGSVIGAGGGAAPIVAYESKLSAGCVLKDSIWKTIPFDNVIIDTHDSYDSATGYFKPSTAGWYQVSSMFGVGLLPENALFNLGIKKNDIFVVRQQNVSSPNSGYFNFDINGLVYLDGIDDYVTIQAYTESSGKADYTTPSSDATKNKFTAVLISGSSGGSGGGGSIWTDENGNAVLGKDNKKLTIDANVAELGAKSRITTDTNTLEFKVGSGGLPDFSLSDTEVILGSDTVTKTRLMGDVVLESEGKKLTLDVNGDYWFGKARITTDTPLLEFKAGSGDLPGVTISADGISTAQDITINYSPNDYYGMTVGTGNSEMSDGNTVVGARASEKQEGSINVTAIGNFALHRNNGSFNTAVGASALGGADNAIEATAVGYNALSGLESGYGNTAIGALAGNTLTSGENNTFIGQGAQPSSPTVSDEITLGDFRIAKLRMGTGAIIWDKSSRDIVELDTALNEVDKKLAIKDKLIEKLSARLDALEKKVK